METPSLAGRFISRGMLEVDFEREEVVEPTEVLGRDWDFERREGRGVAEMIELMSGERGRSGCDFGKMAD